MGKDKQASVAGSDRMSQSDMRGLWMIVLGVLLTLSVATNISQALVAADTHEGVAKPSVTKAAPIPMGSR